MRRTHLGFALMLCGLIALSMAVVGPAPTPVAAGPALQPSPRPTLIPTPDLRGDDYDYADPAPMGRITGTIIDLRTGAPAAGKRVRVGDSEVISDGNGNYDVWVEAGQYPVALAVAAEEGAAAQDVTTATVWGNDAVVVHLFYTSVAPAQAATAAPAAPTPAPAAPTLAPAQPPIALPGELPDTSAEDAPARSPGAGPVAAPATLPETGDELLDPQGVALGGLALLALGAALMLTPRRAPARAGAHASRALRRRKSAEDLLRELLRREP